MQNAQPSLLARDDTFLGVCEALGDDFGFNPLWLRLAFASLLLWNPPVVIGTYLAAGVAVLLSRLICPNPRAKAAPAAKPEPALDGEEDKAEPVALAA